MNLGAIALLLYLSQLLYLFLSLLLRLIHPTLFCPRHRLTRQKKSARYPMPKTMAGRPTATLAYFLP